MATLQCFDAVGWVTRRACSLKSCFGHSQSSLLGTWSTLGKLAS